MIGCLAALSNVGAVGGVDADEAPSSLNALDVLMFIVIENEHPAGYDRGLFDTGRDLDGDGCATRAEVLIRDALSYPQVDPYGCHVLAGEWVSVYDGTIVTDPADLQVDHVVSLKEAWDSGAWQWDDARRSDYANDLLDARTLRAVTGASNQAKGEADPSNWLPFDETFVCTYLADWIAIKIRWGLSMDQSEGGRIRNLLTDRCPGQHVAPWPPTEPWTPLQTELSPIAPTTVGIAPAISTCDPSYPDVCIPSPPPLLNCADIPHRRFRVLPPDPHEFDGNRDGVGCEGPSNVRAIG